MNKLETIKKTCELKLRNAKNAYEGLKILAVFLPRTKIAPWLSYTNYGVILCRSFKLEFQISGLFTKIVNSRKSDANFSNIQVD